MYNDRRLLSSQHLKEKSNQRRKLKNFSEILANRSNSKILSHQFNERNYKTITVTTKSLIYFSKLEIVATGM